MHDRVKAVRSRLRQALSVLSLLAPLIAGAAADPAQDPDQVGIWLKVRASLFGDRPITRDDGEVLTLHAPARAQDAGVVPVSISTHLAPEAGRFVERLYLLIDQNPSPIAAVFTFTRDSGRAGIETRVRVEDYTWMRAVAETSDGRLYISARFVKAAGGCSAPYGTAPDFEAFTPRARLKVDASVVPNEPALAQLMVQHPNSSGLATDQLTHLAIPAYYVRSIQVSYAGRPVLTADIDFSISENPNLRFYFLPQEAGELKAVIIDTKERETQAQTRVELGH
jgi:sulfur-oxidizing protein SoxY